MVLVKIDLFIATNEEELPDAIKKFVNENLATGFKNSPTSWQIREITRLYNENRELAW